ncbi:MAG: DUF3857 and transglutaminase domain-containing protein [Bacteroidota bacterium]|nr:DUF3857 and transglutaminase domain-containing protein [Bacteroidota bacterium]
MEFNKKMFFLFVFAFQSVFLFADGDIKTMIRNAGDADKYPHSSVLTIFDSTTVDVQESGLSYFYIHKLIKVLTLKGAVNSSIVKFSYEPQSAFLQIKKVKIYRKDGSVEILDNRNIKDYPAPGSMILWGAREQLIEVGRLEIGDAIEIFMFKKGYTYALLQEDDNEKYIPPMEGHYYDIIHFWSSNNVLEKVYQTLVPNTKKLQYKFYKGEVNVKVRFKGNKTLYSFQKKNIEPFKRESNMLGLSDVAPKLILTTAPDWEAKSKWFYAVNEDYGSFDCDPEVKEKVDEILRGASDEMDSVSRLTHWVANEIRYFGLTMGEGEGFTLHKALMTYTDRCGVCKDKAGMLIAMLRCAGFESYAAMTMAGSRIEDIPADQFNHSVTAVRLSDGKLHMLDPTWVPFVRELWSSREQQQNYIIGTKEGEDLSIIPISDPMNHFYKIKGNSELDKEGNLKGEFTLEAEGQSDANFRGALTRTFRYNWKSTFESSMLGQFPDMKIITMNFSDPYDMSKPFRIYIKYEIPNYALVSDNEIIFTPVVASNLFSNRNYHLYLNTNIKERKYPFKDACSKYIELNETIKLPLGVEKISWTKAKDIKGSGASFSGSYKLDGNVLHLSEKITLKKRVYQVDDWESVRDAVALQKKFASEKIILKKLEQ